MLNFLYDRSMKVYSFGIVLSYNKRLKQYYRNI